MASKARTCAVTGSVPAGGADGPSTVPDGCRVVEADVARPHGLAHDPAALGRALELLR